MIYKAKPKPHNYGRYDYDWLVDLLDEEGYVQGYYVDGYIVGNIAEVTEDYIHLEYWVPIEKDTLTQVGQEESVKEEVDQAYKDGYDKGIELMEVMNMVYEDGEFWENENN